MADPSPTSRRRLPVGRHGQPAELVGSYQRRRLIEAMVNVVAEKGYARTAVADVIAAAGISRATFYKQFDGKLDCLLAAFDTELDAVISAIQAGYETEERWPERVRGGLAAGLEWLAEHPAAARLLLIEMTAAGPTARRRYRTALSRMTAFLEEGYDATELGRRLSPHTARMAVGAGASLIVDELLAGRGAGLPAMLPDAVYATLVPFLGPREAAAQMAPAAA